MVIDGPAEGAAPRRLRLAADFWVLCPAERRALGHPVLLCPRDDRLALCDRHCELVLVILTHVLYHGLLPTALCLLPTTPEIVKHKRNSIWLFSDASATR